MAQSRRDFLKIAAMLSGAAGISGAVPESIQRAFAIEPAPGTSYLDAEHIVILMQENRSFDHVFGTLQGVRGFNDPRAIRLANGNSVFVQTDAAGDSYSPWRLDIHDTRITWMGSVPHSRHSQVDAWNGGRHDGWLEAKRSYTPEYAHLPLTMGHYTREDLPFYYALADAFTVCDQNYCSVMTSTTPNRSAFWTGTVRDRQQVDSKVFMRNDEILSGGMTWTTYPERLHEAGVSWKFYQNELTNSGGMTNEEQAWLSNFGCNLLEFFTAYNIEAYPGFIPALQDRIASLTKQAAKLEATLESEQEPSAQTKLRARIAADHKLIEKLKASISRAGEQQYKDLNEQQRILHDAAFVTNSSDPEYRALEALAFEDSGKPQQMMVPKGDILHQFRKDVSEGKLPTVSWLSAPEKFSDHPTSPWYGAWYVSEVMDILTKNPEVWKKTIFILTYDENDGYFDHAPSFVAADPKRPATGGASEGIDTGIEYTYAEDELVQGVPEKQARSGPIGMGFRVPMIVASPWTRGGWVNSQLFDHTSTLMFLESFLQQKYGKTVREENISAWRRAISGNLTSCFRSHHAKEPALDFLNRNKFVIDIQEARYKEIPSSYRKLTPAEIEEINSRLSLTQGTAHQESGIRPSCSLPYELYADGSLNPDRTSFTLRMQAGVEAHGQRSAGAPFNVYLRNTVSQGEATGKDLLVATYAVKAGDVLSQEFPLALFADGRYVLDVHGPNGFYRSFAGDKQAPALEVSTVLERHRSRLTGNLLVQLINTGPSSLNAVVKDNAYKKGSMTKQLEPGGKASLLMHLRDSHGWYDFTATTDGSDTEARFAGRVETRGPSFTDPLMGSAL